MPCPHGIDPDVCARVMDTKYKIPNEIWSAPSVKPANPFIDFCSNHFWQTGNWSGTPQTMECSFGGLTPLGYAVVAAVALGIGLLVYYKKRKN